MKCYGDYKVDGGKIGSGAFGEIFIAYNNKNEKFAIKIEKSSQKNPQLFYQAKILQYLAKDGQPTEKGIIKIYEYFSEGQQNVMIMKLLGRSLESLFKQHNRSFPIKTIIMIGLQILDRICFVHSQGLIHRDIKPDNFLIGRDFQSGTVFMIDFGLAKKYRGKDGSHIAYKDSKNLTGTARYASINTHLGIQQGRRDDIQGLIYMLIYFFLGNLPWQNMDAKNKKEKYQKILEKKMDTSPEMLCQGLPQQIGRILKYVRGIFFDQKPDYGYIRTQLQAVLNEYNMENDRMFCWVTL